MALTVKTSTVVDEAILSPHNNLSPGSNVTKSFHAVFEEHMPSSRKPISHDSASVLLLSYDSNNRALTDLNVREELQRLEDVFRKDYGFYVEQQVIKSERSAQLQMTAHLSSFTLRHEKNHALLIVYYAGHGWHSSDISRKNPGRFDLLPRKLEHQEVPSGDQLVVWEASEAILHDVRGDVLVIFDCCDTGALASLRSPGRAFEYLGACERGKYTHPPSEKSFTSALTWALKALRLEPSFTTADLLAKIKSYERFPAQQKPVLFPRWEYMPEHIWISSMRNVATPTTSRRRSSSVPEFRDENCDFVDFRVTFSRPLADEDGKVVAEMMGPLVCNRKLPLNARHVSFLNKGTCKPRKNPTDLWSRIHTHVVAAQRFRKAVDTSDTRPNKKRQSALFEDDPEDSSSRKHPRSLFAVNFGHIDQLPTSPLSEDPDSATEGALSLRIDTAIESTPSVPKPSKPLGSDSTNLIEVLLRDLEKLKQNALHKPELQGVLLAQVRAMLEE